MRFFFYGTLTAESDNAVARRLHRLLNPGVPATVRGQLFAIEDEQGWYPGLIPDPLGTPVHGFLHELTGRFAPEHLAALDRYENYDPLAPDHSEFVRREITVETSVQSIVANAYVLRAPPIKDIVTVAEGCFSSFVRRRSLHSYGAVTPPHTR